MGNHPAPPFSAWRNFCVAPCCSAVQCSAVPYTALQLIALHCSSVHCTARKSIYSYARTLSTGSGLCSACAAILSTALHFTALHCTALHCTALHCTGGKGKQKKNAKKTLGSGNKGGGGQANKCFQPLWQRATICIGQELRCLLCAEFLKVKVFFLYFYFYTCS